jgi:RNA polymerase sigma factor FliA
MAQCSSHLRPPVKDVEQGGEPGLRNGVDALWGAYLHSRAPEVRNQLVEHYMPLVRAASNRMAAELPNSVQIEDLVSVGTFGLMDAIDRFDPLYGVRFETYCSLRIRGAILDELRSLNWKPRLRSSRSGKVEAVIDSLIAELGRVPTELEIAERAGLKPHQVRSISPNAARQISLSGNSDDRYRSDGFNNVAAASVCDPFDVLSEKECRDMLSREVNGLPRTQRLIVMLYYFDELTMKQIGQVLNVTESRVCQMHADILERLQQRLGDLNEFKGPNALMGWERQQPAEASHA